MGDGHHLASGGTPRLTDASAIRFAGLRRFCKFMTTQQESMHAFSVYECNNVTLNFKGIAWDEREGTLARCVKVCV